MWGGELGGGERDFADASEFAGDGDFVDGVFGEGDADGVADAVGEEASDADGAFDAAVIAVTGFGDAEVEGVVPVGSELVELSGKEAVGADHDLWVAGFHGEDEVMEGFVASDASELEGAFDHTFWGIAVAVHDAIGEGAVVGADAEGDAAFFALADEGDESFADAVEFECVFGVGVFADVELFLIGVVTGVDADFFDPFCGFCGGFGLEVDIGDEGHGDAEVTEAGGDVLEVCGVFDGWSGDANDFAACVDEVACLLDAGLGVHGVAGEHGLDADGVISADGDVPDAHDAGGATEGGDEGDLGERGGAWRGHFDGAELGWDGEGLEDSAGAVWAGLSLRRKKSVTSKKVR